MPLDEGEAAFDLEVVDDFIPHKVKTMREKAIADEREPGENDKLAEKGWDTPEKQDAPIGTEKDLEIY
jgi:hypothetical protein